VAVVVVQEPLVLLETIMYQVQAEQVQQAVFQEVALLEQVAAAVAVVITELLRALAVQEVVATADLLVLLGPLTLVLVVAVVEVMVEQVEQVAQV
jgi:hypothetical protein